MWYRGLRDREKTAPNLYGTLVAERWAVRAAPWTGKSGGSSRVILGKHGAQGPSCQDASHSTVLSSYVGGPAASRPFQRSPCFTSWGICLRVLPGLEILISCRLQRRGGENLKTDNSWEDVKTGQSLQEGWAGH